METETETVSVEALRDVLTNYYGYTDWYAEDVIKRAQARGVGGGE